MSSIEKTFTNDEIYQKIFNLYGADFVEKYYSVFDKVYDLIEIPDYNINDVQKDKLFRDAIKEYIAVNKYAAFKNWKDVKLMFDFITVEDLPEMKMVQESNISINEIIEKYGIDGLISSGIDIDCLFMGKKIMELDELSKIKGIEIEDLKKFVYSNDRKILDVCTVDKLLSYGIKNFIELTQLHNLYLINDMVKVIPLNLIRMGANTELKREFIKKYGMDNIIRLDEETGGIFSHQYDENNIYLNIIVMIDKIKNANNKEVYSYEEFRDRMYNVLLNVRNEDIQKRFANKVNYDFIGGKFREDYNRIFIDGVSEEIRDAFYTGKINAGMIKDNPELIDILKTKDLFLAWDKTPNFVEKKTENIYLSNNDNYIVLLKNLMDSLGEEEFLNLCAEYGDYLETLEITGIKVSSKDEIINVIDDEIYNNIVKKGMAYSDDLPLHFREKHIELFFHDNVDEELKNKFYMGVLSFNDIKNNPEFADIVINKDFFVGFKKIIKEMSDNECDLFWTELSIEEIVSLVKRYGDSLKDVKDNAISEYLRNRDEKIIEAEIEKNILSRASKYDEDVPECFKSKYPEMFLGDDAPDDLKRIFYDGDDEFNFNVIRENPEWISYLDGVNLSRAFSENYQLFFEKLSNEKLINLELKNPGVISEMVEDRYQKKLIEWYKATGGRFLPNLAVMKMFPVEEIDKFLRNSKKWSKLVRDTKIKSYKQMEALLKGAYAIGVFDGKDAGFTKLIRLFNEVPQKISRENFELIYDYIKMADESGIDFLNEVYNLNEDGNYSINLDLQKDREKVLKMRKIMNDMNFPGLINLTLMEKMFDRFKMHYNKQFANFLIKNFDKIIVNDEYVQNLPFIQNQFERIIDANIGRVKEITLDTAVYYVKNVEYDNIDIGNDGVAEEARSFGYGQKEFEQIQKIYNEGELRDYSSIPRIVGEENGMKYEMLRCDDPLGLTIGERTDCCQRINDNGVTAMEHSMVSPDGRVFYIRDEFDRIIAQSWVWRNQNVICFDDIEISDKVYDVYVAENSGAAKADLANKVLMVYKKAAKDLMDVDKIKYDSMLAKKIITQEQYDSLLLKKVTVGLGFKEISEAIVADGSLYIDEDPVKVIHPDRFMELYSDANVQYIINEEGYDKNSIYDRTQNLYIYEDDIPIYDISNLSMDVLFKLQRMKNNDRLIDTDCEEFNDLSNSERMMMNVASKYELNPNDTKIVSTARMGLIYSENDECVEIADLITVPIRDDLGFEEKKRMIKHVTNQIKKSLKQIDIGNRRVDMSRLEKSTRGLLTSFINQINMNKIDCEYDIN